MKLFLTQPRETRDARTPMAVLDLACYGRKFGHEVDVGYLDAAPPHDLAGYDMVGVSAIQFDESITKFLQGLTAAYRGRVVLGGKATDAMTGEDLEGIRQLGVEVFEGSGEGLLSPGIEIDYRNYPVWSEADFRIMDYANSVQEAMSSRGCPYYCHFCHNTEHRIHYFSPERTAEHVKLILETLGRFRVFFVDDIFALRVSHMRAVLAACDAIGVNLRKRNDFFVHISQLDEARLDAIDEFQPRELQVGLESGDDGMLVAMGKTFTAAEAEEKLQELHRRGNHVAGLFMMGFPGETRESLQATVDFMARNRKYMVGWWVSYYQPVPNTVGWKLACERAGRRVDGNWNTDVSYLDPNITVEDLQTARKAVMG